MKAQKTAVLVLAALLVISAAAFTATHQSEERPEVLLEKAIQLETVRGDLDSAIDLYKKVVAASRSSRGLVAKALLRLGGCYEKLGLEEARKAYERLVREYADQSVQAQAARSRLAALGKPAVAPREPGFATRQAWQARTGCSHILPRPTGGL